MYEAFFHLTEKPFTIQPDPEFLYVSKRHRLGHSMLQYGVENRAGFSVITGDIGTGKTTLIRHMLNSIESDIRIGLISNTHQEIANLLEWVLLAFDQPYQLPSTVAMYDAFQQYLINEYAEGRRTVLVIDEAQNLNPQALEALRMLSNINVDKHQLLQMILVGQPELKALLRRPELQQFAQRVSVDFHLEPLPLAEVGDYISHRLTVAGADKPLFTPEAIQKVAEASGGVPRRINILCDIALVYAFSQDASMVDLDIVEEVIRDKEEYGVFDPQHQQISDEVPDVIEEGGRISRKQDRLSCPSRLGMASDSEEASGFSSSSEKKPALVIYDRRLAAKIMEKLTKKGRAS